MRNRKSIENFYETEFSIHSNLEKLKRSFEALEKHLSVFKQENLQKDADNKKFNLSKKPDFLEHSKNNHDLHDLEMPMIPKKGIFKAESFNAPQQAFKENTHKNIKPGITEEFDALCKEMRLREPWVKEHAYKNVNEFQGKEEGKDQSNSNEEKSYQTCLSENKIKQDFLSNSKKENDADVPFDKDFLMQDPYFFFLNERLDEILEFIVSLSDFEHQSAQKKDQHLMNLEKAVVNLCDKVNTMSQVCSSSSTLDDFSDLTQNHSLSSFGQDNAEDALNDCLLREIEKQNKEENKQSSTNQVSYIHADHVEEKNESTRNNPLFSLTTEKKETIPFSFETKYTEPLAPMPAEPEIGKVADVSSSPDTPLFSFDLENNLKQDLYNLNNGLSKKEDEYDDAMVKFMSESCANFHKKIVKDLREELFSSDFIASLSRSLEEEIEKRKHISLEKKQAFYSNPLLKKRILPFFLFGSIFLIPLLGSKLLEARMLWKKNSSSHNENLESFKPLNDKEQNFTAETKNKKEKNMLSGKEKKMDSLDNVDNLDLLYKKHYSTLLKNNPDPSVGSQSQAPLSASSLQEVFLRASSENIKETVKFDNSFNDRTSAVENKNAKIFFDLATVFFQGKSVGVDMSKAALWYKKSAELGYAPGQYRIANMYEKGLGIKPDFEKARFWYEVSAQAGNVQAMHNLGGLYALGIQGTPDNKRALYWFCEAAAFGFKDSQFNAAILYANPTSGFYDLKQSYKWFSLAAQENDLEAFEWKEKIAKMLTPEQREQVSIEISTWKKKKVEASVNLISSSSF